MGKNKAVNKKKMVRMIAGGLGVCLLGGCLCYFINLGNYKRKVAQIQIKPVELSKIPDGTYTGKYDVGFIEAKVEVKVADGKLEDVKLVEHKNEKGQPAEQIVKDMVTKQSNQVDAVTGATNSSKVIMKAVENALLSAQGQSNK